MGMTIAVLAFLFYYPAWAIALRGYNAHSTPTDVPAECKRGVYDLEKMRESERDVVDIGLRRSYLQPVSPTPLEDVEMRSPINKFGSLRKATVDLCSLTVAVSTT